VNWEVGKGTARGKRKTAQQQNNTIRRELFDFSLSSNAYVIVSAPGAIIHSHSLTDNTIIMRSTSGIFFTVIMPMLMLTSFLLLVSIEAHVPRDARSQVHDEGVQERSADVRKEPINDASDRSLFVYEGPEKKEPWSPGNITALSICLLIASLLACCCLYCRHSGEDSLPQYSSHSGGPFRDSASPCNRK
jgi:hypothetical protein